MERAAFGRQRRQSLRGHVNLRLVRMRLVQMRSRISGAYGQSHANRHSCNYRFRHDRNLLVVQRRVGRCSDLRRASNWPKTNWAWHVVTVSQLR
jgi:hypothetical protein